MEVADYKMDIQNNVIATFHKYFSQAPNFCVLSPGRVNLIGEHTDYNDGYVLPMAIDRFIWIAARANGGRSVRVYSLDFDESVEFDLDSFEKGEFAWKEYIKAVAWALNEAGHGIKGFDAVVAGNIPIGAGLSSSAALELAMARVFVECSGIDWEKTTMARICQRAENRWIGVGCGIMDQLVCCAGHKGHALLIDCRNLAIRPVLLPPQTTVVILDTTTRRDLVNSAYQERRDQCEVSARIMGVASLREAGLSKVEAFASRLGPVHIKRARHVVMENLRVKMMVKALEANEAKEAGRLMTESHQSLRDDYEVSGEALNDMVECALEAPGCLGARMTGAGFFGCAVALIRSSDEHAFIQAVSDKFLSKTHMTPRIYPCRPQQGTAISLL